MLVQLPVDALGLIIEKKKIKIQEMRAETTEIDEQIAELESSSEWTLNIFTVIQLLLLIVP